MLNDHFVIAISLIAAQAARKLTHTLDHICVARIRWGVVHIYCPKGISLDALCEILATTQRAHPVIDNYVCQMRVDFHTGL
jgi:hypothetical protein